MGLTLTKYEIGDHYDGPGPGTSGPIIQYRVEGLPLEERAFIANFCVFPCDESWRVFHTKKGIDAHRDGDYKTADDALPFHHRLAYTERQMRHTSCLAALVALTAIALYAERLTIVDVVTMVQAKVPQDIIIQKIADCEPDFDLRPGALAASARSRALRSGNGKTASLPVNIAMAGRNTRASKAGEEPCHLPASLPLEGLDYGKRCWDLERLRIRRSRCIQRRPAQRTPHKR